MNIPREVFDDAERHALAAEACLSTAAAALDAETFADDIVTARLIDRATQLAAHAADLALEISERARAGTLCEVITLTPPARDLERIPEPGRPARTADRQHGEELELLAHSVVHRQIYFNYMARYPKWVCKAADTMGALMTLACEATLEIEA